MRKMLFPILLLFLFCILLTSCEMIPEGLIPDFLKSGAGTTAAPQTTTTAPATVRAVPAINGHELSEYTIVAGENAMEDAAMLSAMLKEAYGVTLTVATEARGLQILLSKSDTLAVNHCELRATDDGIAVYGTGVNATYLAAHALCDRIARIADTAEKNLVIETSLRVSVASHLPRGTMDLLDGRGINSDFDGTLNIAFLGGSLTQGKTAWTEPVADYFRTNMPDATVNTLNAGIGATDSECGAIRFQKDVLDKMIPDIIFIDYAVNDGGFADESDEAVIKNGAYIESIIKQCRALDEPPVIILLYFPLGQRGVADNRNYVKWKNGTALKDSLAAHYGIGTIDVWAHFEALYQKALKRDETLSYDAFLDEYYAKTDLVHPMSSGFAVFGEAILKALRADLPKYLINKTEADTYFTAYADVVDLDYTLLSPTEIAQYAGGEFTHYTGAYATADDPAYIPSARVSATQLTDGVLQIEGGKGFTITLETAARAIKLYGINSPDGMKLEVLSDGVVIGTIDTKENNTYLYTLGVMIPSVGQESHTVTLRPAADNSGTVFRVGYIALGK